MLYAGATQDSPRVTEASRPTEPPRSPLPGADRDPVLASASVGLGMVTP